MCSLRRDKRTFLHLEQMGDDLSDLSTVEYLVPHLPLCEEVKDLHVTRVQIQPRKRMLDHADCLAPTRQHELDHTDNT